MKQLNTSKYNLLISLFLLWGCSPKVEIFQVMPQKVDEVLFQPDTINYIEIGLDHLKQHEGFRADYYSGPAGHQLIGYGHERLPDENYIGLTRDLASDLLESDFTTHLSLVEIRHPNYSHKQQVALALFSFNLGSGALKKAVGNGITTNKNKWLKYCHYRSKGKVIKSKRLEERRIFETNLFFKL